MKKHAVLIGINKYKRLGQLRYARQDAEAVADALKRCYGFSDDEITLLTDADESKNAPEDRFVIEDALSPDFYANDLDLFVFGFWGHGIWEGDQRYLCPMNVRDNILSDTALPLKTVQTALGRLRVKNICLILDCCQNEVSTEARSAAQAMTAGEESSLNLLARDIALNLKKKTANPDFAPTVVVLNSCKKGERAFESAERGHGLFTAILLEAMENRCDNTEALYKYVSAQVPEILRTAGHHQTPYYTSEGAPSIVLPAVKKGYDVFLSYRRSGASEAAKLLQTQLESRHVRVFLDVNESMIGDHFDETLLTRIEESACFVPILSPGCFSRPDAMSDNDWIYKECLHAVRSHKPIVPVFASGFSWNSEKAPERVKWLQRIDSVEYHPVYVEGFLDRLVNAVRNPGKLNHKAILKQMTAPYRAPAGEADGPVKSLKTAEELGESDYPVSKQKEEEERRSVMRKWTIGGILAGVILVGVVLSALLINAGIRDKRAERTKETEAVVSETAPVAVFPTDVPTREEEKTEGERNTPEPGEEAPYPVVFPTNVPTPAEERTARERIAPESEKQAAPDSVTVPTDVPTLAEAYETIATGGAITVLRGKYEIPQTITITKNVKITGDVSHPEYVVLQGGEENVFRLQSGFAEIAGLTIQNEGKERPEDIQEDEKPAFARRYSAFVVSAPLCVIHNCVFISRNCCGFVVNTKDSNPDLKNCAARNCGLQGFWIGAGASGTFRNCTVSGNALSGMVVGGAQTNPTVEDCRFIDGEDCGILVFEGASGTFRNCTASGNAYPGMVVQDAQSNPTVEDCRFTEGKDCGIFVCEGASGTFRNCTASENACEGMVVADALSNPTVEDSRFTDGKDAGIVVCDGASGTFWNCTASENACEGMAVGGALSNPTVEGCTFEKNQQGGVYVYNGASGTFRRNKLSGHSTKFGNWDVSGAASDLVRERNTPNR